MPLPEHINDRVKQSYVHVADGQTAVRSAANYVTNEVVITDGSLGIGGPSDPMSTDGLTSATIQINWDVVAASALGFVDGDVSVADNSVGETAHGYLTGLEGQLTTSGTLPGGLATATNYYLIRVDADNYKFATSRANAEAGTAVDITSAAGGGTHTFTPTGCGTVGEFVVQGTVYDLADDNWGTIDLSTAVTVANTDNSALIRLTSLPGDYIRIGYNATSGQGTYTAKIKGRG
jgi:hypothetical protein